MKKNERQAGHAYRQAGFTFVETIMAMFIGSVVVSSGFVVQKLVTQNYTESFEEVRQIDEVGMVVRRWVNELREIRDGEDGAYPLLKADDNEIIFFSDVDNDRKTERLRYFLEGSALKRGLIQPTGDPARYELAQEVVTVVSDKMVADTTPLFTYYNRDYPGDMVNNPIPMASRLLSTRAVRLTVKVGLSKDFAVPDLKWESLVQLRNLSQIE